MDVILELLFGGFGLFLETAFEIIVQIVFELAVEMGLRSLAEPFRKPKPVNPILAGIGYVLLGAIAGGASLLIPRVFTAPQWLRFLNLLVTPVVCGYIMAKVGKIRERRGERVLRIDSFLYGYLFALAMVVVRLIWR